MSQTIESVFHHLQKVAQSNVSDKEWSREVKLACEKLFEITQNKKLIDNSMWFVALGEMWNNYLLNETATTKEKTS